MRSFPWFVALLSLAVLSLAPAEARAQRGRCSPVAIDSAHTANGPVFRDCDVDRKAAIRVEPKLDYPVADGVCVIAEVEFVVDTAGVPDITQTIIVVDASDPVFLRELTKQVRSFRYRPAIKDGMPVRQVVRVRRTRERSGKRFGTIVSMQAGGMPRSSTAVGAAPSRSGGPSDCR